MGRHWCVCRGGACPARPRSGKRTAKSIGCTAVSDVPPDVSLRGGRRPTWRPEREARGSALGVQSREGTADLERLSLKWYVPIASVAAVTAQPLTALPPYGCGVPLAGNERPAGWQYLRHKFIGAMPSSLSLRGGRRPTWQSRSTRPDHRKAIGENAAAFPRLPRRFAPRNDTSGAVAILTMPCTSRRFTAGTGCPLPYSTPRPAGFFSIVPYSPGKIHPVGKKRSLSVKSMEKRLKTGPFCDTINLYQNECTARRRGLHLHTDTTILGGKHHECSRDHGTAQRIFL